MDDYKLKRFSNYPRMLKYCEELEGTLFPNSIITNSSEVIYQEYICLGLNKETNKIEQVLIQRSSNLSKSAKEVINESNSYIKEADEYYTNFTWYKVHQNITFLKVDNV